MEDGSGPFARARIKEPHLLPRSEKVKYEAFEELKTGKGFELLDL